MRPASGQGSEELIYRNPGAFMNLSDWSSDGRFLSFAISDLKGGTLYALPLDGGSDRTPIQIFHSDLRLFGPRFSPDGRFLSYIVVDQANRTEVFVRPLDSATTGGPWQISDGSFSAAFWRRDGTELYYLARDQSIMVAEVKYVAVVLIHQTHGPVQAAGRSSRAHRYVSADGERFLALPPPRGPQLQQITIFDRQGQVVQKVGEPGLYGQPSFSPDGAAPARHEERSRRPRKRICGRSSSRMGRPRASRTIRCRRRNRSGRPTASTSITPRSETATCRSSAGPRMAVATRTWCSAIRQEPASGHRHFFRWKFLVCDSGGVILVVPLTGRSRVAQRSRVFARRVFRRRRQAFPRRQIHGLPV